MAGFIMKLRHLCFTVVLSSMAISCCRGQGGGAVVPGTQDAIQIVAQAALCFDNRQVINGCLQSLGINVTGNGSTSTAAPAPRPSAAGTGKNNGSVASICQGPCFKQMTLVMTCVNGVLSNIQGYRPGLMQGVQAIFQMSCGNVSNGQGGGGTGGSAAVPSGSHVAVSNLGELTSSAAGPRASLKSGFPSMLITWNCIWLLPLMYVAL